MDTLDTLRRKIDGARDIQSVVRTMKAMAASNIGQYETAVDSLGDYYSTVSLGLVAYFRNNMAEPKGNLIAAKKKEERIIYAIVFGSDQGLVGQFNDTLANFVKQSLNALAGKKEIWAIGERVQLIMADEGYEIGKSFLVPNSVAAISPLVSEILVKSEESYEIESHRAFYIFHNQPNQLAGYSQVIKRLLPLDEQWRQEFIDHPWPSQYMPQLAGDAEASIKALIHEYLFISLFKACTESLASENASRLMAMQRAEKNIDELQDNLSRNFHRLRQSSIDEELFDVVSGYEAMNKGLNQ